MFGTLKKLFYRWPKAETLQLGPTSAEDGVIEGSPQTLCTMGGNLDGIEQILTCQNNLGTSTSGLQRKSVDVCEHNERMEPSDFHGLLDQPNEFHSDKEDFLSVYSDDYGYDGQLELILRTEFRRLQGQAYLDYAGAALYSESQLRSSSEELIATLLCNPHSAPTSAAADAIAALRRATLELLHADGRQYEVIITSGATAALKMVAECFPWRAGASRLAHPVAVHNSVLGMRGPALAAGAAVQLVHIGGPTEASGIGTAGRHGVTTAPSGAVEDAEGTPPQLAPSYVRALGAPMTAAGAADGARAVGAGVAAGSPTWHLLALPAECNFTGDREALVDIVRHVQRYGIAGVASSSKEAEATAEDDGCGDGPGRWLVLLDAAKACATAPPDLSTVPANFVVLSYYKIFGHPTGLGALVVRKDSIGLLAAGKSYFGGGTVEVAVADQLYHVRRNGAPGLEDGTPPFTSVVAARHGFNFLHSLGGLPAVHHHSCCLARWLVARLAAMRHANGAPVAVIYGRWCAAAAAAAAAAATAGTSAVGAAVASLPDHGPTVSFNLLRPDGSWVGHAEVARLAAMHGLHLRTGCFCNPGACAQWLGLSAEDVIRHHRAGHVCWDEHDLVDGRPTGAVRVSLGAASSFTDVYALLKLVRRYFVDDGSGSGGGKVGEGTAAAPAQARPSAAAPLAHVTRGEGTGREERAGKEWQPPAQPGPLVPAAAAAAAAAAACGAAEPFMGGASTGQSQTQLLRTQPPSQGPLGEVRSPPSYWLRDSVPARHLDAVTPRPVGTQPQPRRFHPVNDSSVPDASITGPTTDALPSADGADRRAGGSRRPSVRERTDDEEEVAEEVEVEEGEGQQRGLVAASGHLSRILLYPVKSCAAQEVTAWPIGPTGLLYDREWALVDDSGKVLTLKQCPRMALIRPVVDLTRGTLNIHAPKDASLPPLELAIPRQFRRACHHPATLAVEAGPKPPGAVAAAAGSGGGASTGSETSLVAEAAAAETGARAKDSNAAVRHRNSVRLDAGLTLERVQVCGDTVCSDLADAYHDPEGDARIRKWFVRLLGVPCRIVQQRTGARKVRRPVGKGTKGPISSSSPSQGRSSSSSSSSSQPAQQRQSKDSGNDEGTQAASGAGTNEEPSVGFANDGQYLLVSEASLGDLRMRLQLRFPTGVDTGGCSSGTSGSGSNAGGDGSDSSEGDDLVARLRPNLVVSGFLPYEEDGWVGVRVGPLHANVLGTCPRCELLQVDPRVGVRRGAEVLVALAQYRRNGGRVQFGILLAAEPVTAGRMAQASSEIARLRAENGMDTSAAAAETSPACVASGVAVADLVGRQCLRGEFEGLPVITIGDRVFPSGPVGAAGSPAGC